MVRLIAFASGVAAGIGLLLLLFAGLSFSSTSSSPVRSANAMTLDVQQDTGTTVAHPTDPHGDLAGLGDDDADDGTQVDLQGDEVTPAVATYKFDAHGNIYETHAPHTEIPHLGSPTL